MTTTQLPIYQPSGIIINNLEYYLTLACIITGLAYLARILLRYTLKDETTNETKAKQPKTAAARLRYWLLDHPTYNIADWFWLFLLVLVLRSFVFQLYRVPTGSLEPTVMPGDILLVNQFAYGLYLPVNHKKIYANQLPKRGEIAVFRWPVNPSIVFVKRVIGVPGDHVVYKNKQLTINGKSIKITPLKAEKTQPDVFTPSYKVWNAIEYLMPIKHNIFLLKKHTPNDAYSLDVNIPKKQYLMMGDNRDLSNDSRFWGFVPENDFIGKAEYIVIGTHGSIFKPNLNRWMIRL
jgi:signal peptidase I